MNEWQSSHETCIPGAVAVPPAEVVATVVFVELAVPLGFMKVQAVWEDEDGGGLVMARGPSAGGGSRPQCRHTPMT
jgi:hypothetical protein